MKVIITAFLFLAIICTTQAQFKNSPIEKRSPTEGIVNGNAGLLFGIIDPSKFSMSHSYSLSYMTGGGNGLALGMYTNTMQYAFTDNLNLRVDANLVHSPYSSFGKNVTDRINGIYIGNAELHYKPSENFLISLQYRQLPGNGYGSGFGMYGNPYYNSFFGEPLLPHNP